MERADQTHSEKSLQKRELGEQKSSEGSIHVGLELSLMSRCFQPASLRRAVSEGSGSTKCVRSEDNTSGSRGTAFPWSVPAVKARLVLRTISRACLLSRQCLFLRHPSARPFPLVLLLNPDLNWVLVHCAVPWHKELLVHG